MATVPAPRLLGVLITYRRPEALATSLAAVSSQTRTLDRLLVVDNAPDSQNEAVVRSAGAEYVPELENLGPAGGIAHGMELLAADAADRDWIVVLDDDDPPPHGDVFAGLTAFAGDLMRKDPNTAAVGRSGVRFNRRVGQIVRVPDAELHDAVAVDCIGGNQFPTYSVRAVRAVGTPRRELFFGLDDLEYGLRFRDAGYSLYGNASLWRDDRDGHGRRADRPVASRILGEPTWRRYYSLRNLIYILRERALTRVALRVTFLAGLGKPIANLPNDPGGAMQHLRLNWRACRDGWTNRMGRTIDPS